MPYLTTMNLPAPKYERFQEIYQQYAPNPAKAVADFESALIKFFNVQAVETFSNCFSAISMALLYAVRNGPKSVAIAGLAYRRTTDIVLWSGLRPIYVDNEIRTLGMCPKHLKMKLEVGKIGCVLLQHPMVNILDVDRYSLLCREFNVPLVIDSVEATGGNYKNKRVGGMGIAEGFSLHPSKVINGAEGGILTFGQKAECQAFRDYLRSIGLGRNSEGKCILGLEPLHAMMGLASLECYPVWRALFRAHYLTYRELLADSRFYRLVEYDTDADPNFKSVLVELLTFTDGLFRDHLINHLEQYDIGVRPYYAPIHPMANRETLPMAEALSKRFIFLPIGHGVSGEDIEFICEKMLTCAEGYHQNRNRV